MSERHRADDQTIKEGVKAVSTFEISESVPKTALISQKLKDKKVRYATHLTRNCPICRLPRMVRLRVEEDYANWTSARQISNDLKARGYLKIEMVTVYRHCLYFRLDEKRATNMERGVARVVDRGFELLDEGRLIMKASDLIAAITLQCKLKGLLSDNQAINNILIRNNIQPLEELAKFKNKDEIGDRAAQIIKELQEAGVLPGTVKLTDEQVHYNRVAEITQAIIAKKGEKSMDDGAGVNPDATP